MKRILAIDGGGIRGLFALQILARIEELLRQERQRSDLVLSDEFDLFAGTSTGAIIATGLCWGMAVREIEQFYLTHGPQMFSRVPMFQRWKCKYRAEQVASLFQSIFHEGDDARTPSLLGTSKLRKLLLVVMRNATTGSPWPVTNNPLAKYNSRSLPDCNLEIPLWQLLRASTAAPSFYAPECIQLGEQKFLFVDGAITPYNNPTLIAVLTATLAPYRICWPATAEDLWVVSVGTGGVPARLTKTLPQRVHLIEQAQFVPLALINSSVSQQDYLCRILGRCTHGEQLDSELGDLLAPTLLGPYEQKFTYARYDTRLDRLVQEKQSVPRMDDLRSIPLLKQIGEEYAERSVALSHFLPPPEAHGLQGVVKERI